MAVIYMCDSCFRNVDEVGGAVEIDAYVHDSERTILLCNECYEEYSKLDSDKKQTYLERVAWLQSM